MGWLKQTSSYYDAHVDGWEVAEDHLSGAAGTDQVHRYLKQKEQGESDEAYGVRQEIADYTPHYMRAVISLAGMVFAQEDEAERSWGEDALGAPEAEGSIMRRLSRDADGKGTNWETLFKQAAIDIIAKREIWCIAEGVRRAEDGTAIDSGSIRIIPPESVYDVVEKDGRPVEVKVKSERDTRESVKQEEAIEEEFFVYTLGGYEVWQSGEGEGSATRVGGAPYGGEGNPGFRYYATPDANTAVLPIFRVEAPIRTNVGYLMAKKATAIYNMESARDWHLWASCFARLVIESVENSDSPAATFDERWSRTLELMMEGSTVMPGPAQYISPPMDGATVRNETIDRKIEDFYHTFFQSYGDAAQERTATEIQQDARSGVAAYLGLLAGALDEAENGALWRLEQINFPGEPERWDTSHVRRQRDFSPVDVEAAIEGLTTRWVGDAPLPLTEGVAARVVQQVAKQDGVSVSEEEAEEMGAWLAGASQARAKKPAASLNADLQYRQERGGMSARAAQLQTEAEGT